MFFFALRDFLSFGLALKKERPCLFDAAAGELREAVCVFAYNDALTTVDVSGDLIKIVRCLVRESGAYKVGFDILLKYKVILAYCVPLSLSYNLWFQ